MKKLKFIFLTFIAIVILSSFRQDNVITIFMIGDSTMANKDISNGKQERGWGMVLQCYFDDGIRIDNHAMNGRSSKSFITEGRWERVLEKMRPGDYVIIQFGHNDEKPKADRHTDPGSTFDYNLSKFVREARERGGDTHFDECCCSQKLFEGCTQER
jgi:pectinesterase